METKEKTLLEQYFEIKDQYTVQTMEASLLEELRMLNLCKMTPFEAMKLLYEWRERFGTAEA